MHEISVASYLINLIRDSVVDQRKEEIVSAALALIGLYQTSPSPDLLPSLSQGAIYILSARCEDAYEASISMQKHCMAGLLSTELWFCFSEMLSICIEDEAQSCFYPLIADYLEKGGQAVLKDEDLLDTVEEFLKHYDHSDVRLNDLLSNLLHFK